MASYSHILDAEFQMLFNLISENSCEIGKSVENGTGEEINTSRSIT